MDARAGGRLSGPDGRAHRGREPREPEDPARPRLFFAVPLPDDVREGIRPIVDSVQAGVGDGHARIRWVRIDSLHVTLRFLGPTPLDEAAVLGRAAGVAAAEVAPFDVVIAGAGAFPTATRPRTLWLGLTAGVDGLARLATELDRALALTEARGEVRTDLRSESRPFTPHLTIARTDGLRAAADAARALAAAVGDHEWRFRAERIVLFRSHLGRGPAWYEPIAEAPLGG
jgi:2'-5' RNA ligase